MIWMMTIEPIKIGRTKRGIKIDLTDSPEMVYVVQIVTAGDLFFLVSRIAILSLIQLNE